MDKLEYEFPTPGVSQCYAPEGLAHHFPGVNCIPWSKLSALSSNHQHHADGHEKLNAQALDMGGVGLNIYGIKDQWSFCTFFILLWYPTISWQQLLDMSTLMPCKNIMWVAYSMLLVHNTFWMSWVYSASDSYHFQNR